MARLFILFTKTARPPPSRNQLVVPKTNQEINEPSYEMVGVKIKVTNYGQNKSYFWHFFSCSFFIFFSDNSKCFHRNSFGMYILIIIYTVCTCDTLVPTRISPNGAPCHSLLGWSVKSVTRTRTGNWRNVPNRKSFIIDIFFNFTMFCKKNSFIVYFYILETQIIIRRRNIFKKLKSAVFWFQGR